MEKRDFDRYSLANSRESSVKNSQISHQNLELENRGDFFSKPQHKNSGRLSKRKERTKRNLKKDNNSKINKILLRV